jgi:hypothetical protein
MPRACACQIARGNSEFQRKHDDADLKNERRSFNGCAPALFAILRQRNRAANPVPQMSASTLA